MITHRACLHCLAFSAIAPANGLSPMLCRTFVLNRERAVDYLNMLERIYVFDGFAGWDPEVGVISDPSLLTSEMSCMLCRNGHIRRIIR